MLDSNLIAAAQTIANVSVGLWALEMALYIFVFRYFREKPEKERFVRGKVYWEFFVEIWLFSVLTFATTYLAVVALLFAEPLFLAAAWAIFSFNLVSGVVIVVREIRTTLKFVAPYAAPYYFVETITRAYAKAVKKEMSKVSGREAAERIIKAAIEKAFEGAETKAQQAPAPKGNNKSEGG